MKESVIIVASGSGTRMKSEVPKQFLSLLGRPLLMHTIERFYAYCTDIEIVVVLNEDYISYWEQLCEKYNFTIRHTIVKGGKERFYSVKNGLVALSKGVELVAVHDGVRPNITPQKIAQLFEAARVSGAVVPVVELSDSLRQIDENGGSHPVSRSQYKAVQTPQCFDIEIIKRAYEQGYDSLFTDDASVVERCGKRIVLCEGEVDNIKVTYPRDIIILENIMK